MTFQNTTHTDAPTRTVAGRIRAALSDMHHASRRIIEIQTSTGPNRLR